MPNFQNYFGFLSKGNEEVNIEYVSQLNEGGFAEQLETANRKDGRMGYTTIGTHKDDLIFKIGNNPIKKFGSQGQQKSFLIALKLTQFEYIKELLQKMRIPLDSALLMDIDFEILMKRLVGRRTCSKTGKLLNIYFSSKKS